VIEIKHRFTGETIYTFNGDSLRQADLRWADLRQANLRWANLEGANLEGANLRRANLEGANLRRANLEGAILEGADLRRANLEGADLRWCIGDGAIIRAGQFPGYSVVSCDDMLAIGCKAYRVHEWRDFSDDQIESMDDGALEWWAEWKDVVMAFVDCP